MARVLLVDDEELLLTVLKTLLRTKGYEVLTAQDGYTALELVKSAKPEVVISDIRMNPMNGLELLRHIRRECPDLPVVMLTGYSTAETEEETKALGAFGYLRKPFVMDDVIRTVRAAVETAQQKGAPPPA